MSEGNSIKNHEGDTISHPRAFIKTGVIADTTGKKIDPVLTTIREGFSEVSKPEPRRSPPETQDGTFKPPVKILRPGQVIKPRKEPYNLNRNNPGSILRIFLFDETSAFPGTDIFVEVNQKKMTRPKYWTSVRTKLAEGPQPVYLRVDYARKINRHIREKEPFYSHVLSSGTLLYAESSNIWAQDPAPAHATPANMAQRQMDSFLKEIEDCKGKQKKFWQQDNFRRTGFEIRNSIELAYHMILTIHIGHSYPETDISFLRERAEAVVPDLRQAWFYQQETYEAEFERLRHAHKDTHKARAYKISEEEVKTLTYRQKTLLKMANNLCQKKIKSL